VPCMLVRMNPRGSAIDRSTCVSAAKFTIASQSPTASATAAGSSIAPSRKRMSAATSFKFSSRPAYVNLSSTVT
jgi:hypothetical protein